MRGWLPGWRVAGVEVKVHLLVLVVPVLLALTARREDGDLAWRIGAYGALLLAVLVHELGHALAARRRGLAVAGVRIHALGAWALVERRWPEAGTPADEWVVALAGPAANLLVAALLAAGAVGLGWAPRLEDPVTLLHPVALLAALQALLGVGNLVPAFPADGGRVVRAWLAPRLGYARATDVAATLGALIALVGLGAALAWNRSWLLPVGLAAGLLLVVGARERTVARGRELAVEEVRPAARP